MADHTKIEWCDATVNWWAGCTQVSPGCDGCYAKRMAARLWGTQWGPGEPRRFFRGAAETLRALDRKAQRLGQKLTVFHNSLSDMADREVTDAFRMDAFRAMADTPNLIHIVLTKRIGNLRSYLERDALAAELIRDGRVWLGITVCNQEEAGRDIKKLAAVKAKVRLISIEPLLGPVDLGLVTKTWAPGCCNHCCNGDRCDDPSHHDRAHCPHCHGTGGQPIKWVIVGGESGPTARPMHPDWVRSLRDQCLAADVPFMFKQWGEYSGDHATRADARKWTMVDREGRTLETAGSTANMGPITHVAKIGKKAAGRLLDGVEHNGRPE